MTGIKNQPGDLDFARDEYSFYCPVAVCHFPGMTYDEWRDLDDGAEDWFLDEHRIQETAFLKDDAAAELNKWPDIQKNMAYLQDEFPDILPHVTAAYMDFVDKGGRLWLKIAFAMKEIIVSTEKLRDFAAQCINDCAIPGSSFQKGDDLYLTSIEPYRIYNQTNCAAPVYQENVLLTEEEMQEPQDKILSFNEFVADHVNVTSVDDEFDEDEDEAFGGMNLT